MSDIKAILKNIQSVLRTQTESMNQLSVEFKNFKENSSMGRTGIPAPPPPPPPVIQPKRIEKVKIEGLDAMLTELKNMQRYTFRIF